jgi:hypothetical protein
METFIDWALVLLKFTGIALSGIFGIVALLVQYKDTNGKITIWGRRALFGETAASSSNGLRFQFSEHIKPGRLRKARGSMLRGASVSSEPNLRPGLPGREETRCGGGNP